MVYRERSSYNLPYQKQVQTACLSLRMPKSFRIFALLLAIILFVTFLNPSRNIYHIHTKPFININKNKGQANPENDIVVVVDGEKQALSLQPTFCQLSTHRSINTHVIVTGQGRGLGKSLLINL